MRVRRAEWLAAAGIAALLGCESDNDLRTGTQPGRPATAAGGEGPPSDATAVLKSASAIELRWRDNSSKETGYRVERSTGGGPFSLRATVGANVTVYTDAGLAAGVQSCYRVAAV